MKSILKFVLIDRMLFPLSSEHKGMAQQCIVFLNNRNLSSVLMLYVLVNNFSVISGHFPSSWV